MDFVFNTFHAWIRILIVVLFPLGLWTGAFGIWLSRKYANSKNEDMIVTGGMIGMGVILVGIFCLGVVYCSNLVSFFILASYVIALPLGIGLLIRHRKRQKAIMEKLLKE